MAINTLRNGSIMIPTSKAIEVDTFINSHTIKYVYKRLNEPSEYCSGEIREFNLYSHDRELLDYFIGVL